MRTTRPRSRVADLVNATALVAAVSIIGLVPRPADARDPDGSRLGAEEQELGTSRDDTLDPPDDRADWCYVQIKEAMTVRFSLDNRPTEKTAKLRITRATGDELDSESTSGGNATIERELEPGLYYVEVSASSQMSYSLRIE